MTYEFKHIINEQTLRNMVNVKKDTVYHKTNPPNIKMYNHLINSKLRADCKEGLHDTVRNLYILKRYMKHAITQTTGHQ
jgi:hypothetical protein